MKEIVVLIFLIAVLNSSAQDCKVQAANRPSTTERYPDVIIGSGTAAKANINPALIKTRLVKTESWLNGLLKGFTGAKLGYQNNYAYNNTSDFAKLFTAETGLKGYYYSQMRFFAYYCNQDKIIPEGESGSAVMVYVNSFFAGYGPHGLCTDIGPVTINGKPVFEIFEKKSTQGRIDLYERMWQVNVNDNYGSKDDYIVIRNSDQPVFIPITRKELLSQLLKDIEVSRALRTTMARSMHNPANEAANKAAFDAELKRIDNSKNYTKEQMAPYRKRLVETFETEQQKLDKEINKIEADTKGAKEVVSEYMKRPAEWLGRTIKHIFSGSVYNALSVRHYLDELDVNRYRPEEETSTLIVSLNPSYYNKSLAADVPQLILIQVAKGSYPHMKKVADLIRKPGALAPLEALLNSNQVTTR
jgi:hypothetical protein